MQIGGLNNYRMFQVGTNHSMTGMQEKSGHHLKVSDMFGPQCKVTLSREGKKLSKESAQETPRSFMAASAGRLLLREQQQAETDKKESSNMLDEISGLMDSIRNSYASSEDKETIAKKEDALQRLLDLKVRQDQENKQRAEDAAGSAATASKEQEEIDQKNADLYLLLKSLEEQEDEDEISGSSTKEASTTDDTEHKPGGIGDEISQAATMLGATAAKRELQAKGTIDELRMDGYNKLAKANEMMREIQAEIDMAKEAAGKEGLSAEDRQELVSGHMETAKGMLMSNYDEIMHLRSSGIQETKDARELDLKHIQDSPLNGVKQAKQKILQTGADSAQNEVAQSTLDKASKELEQRVQEAIDKRNEAPAEAEDVEEVVKEKEAETNEEKLEQERLEQEKQERKK
ncbi:MAG TPA: hypothetical protein DEB74_06665 [Lachnospiraceae bacterium]|nr:hypothetical protein [Lachnospiraceae bacterium]